MPQQHKFCLIFQRSSSWSKLFAIAICLIGMANSARILAIFPHSSESHFVVMRTFITELAKRNHNVTLYSSHRLDERFDNLHENIIEPEFQFWKEVQKQAGVKDLQALSTFTSDNLNKYLSTAGQSLMDYFLSNQIMQDLLKTSQDNFDFDLIIVDLFYTEAMMALGYHFSVPVVGVVSTDFANYMDQIQDLLVPTACLPYDLKNYNQNLGFWSRLATIKACLKRRQFFVDDHYDRQEQVIKKHFQPLKASVPSIVDLQANLALLLVNNYYPLAAPKPLIPSIVPVGGLHIRATKELPWHIRRFLDETRAGVIYMHLGDEKNCADIPKDKLDILFHILGKRPERILWTCHDVQKLDGLPKNMMIQHLVPQTDILAHPHIKLFVMNGDIMGLQESIIRHVPLLGITLFENEVKNIMLAEKLQIGIRVDYNNLTENSLTWALETILHKEFYVLNIRDVSKVFRDRPLGGLANAIFWLEFIDRYGSGPLKTNGIGMPLSHLHLSDLRLYNYLMAFIVLGVLIGLYFSVTLLWKKRQTAKMFSKLN